ncbi:MAG: histidine triad nucleotide-binding protein [Chloroflexi bacterium]|nr:histidine triad nucleotide-binding protein [Chloroflexota bacterium]
MTTDCLFCNMVSGEMAVEKLHDDDLCFAIRDINPRAPVHLLVIPKIHIATMRDVQEEHGPLLGRMTAVANRLAEAEGISERGYRLTFNVGDEGGQTVYHIHLHVLGGRQLGAEG